MMFLSKICSSLFRQPLTRILGQSSFLGDGQAIIKCPFVNTLVQNYSNSVKPVNEYESPSPYKIPKPKKYGYTTKYFTGGLIPRVKTNRQIKSLPTYKPNNSWSKEKALFGQNDYIDILDDGNIHPKDLIRGPPWLIGFRGNELQRLSRRMRYEGEKLHYLYPTKFHKIQKRIRWLYRFYNQDRKSVV